jgi:hypothetical protein
MKSSYWRRMGRMGVQSLKKKLSKFKRFGGSKVGKKVLWDMPD